MKPRRDDRFDERDTLGPHPPITPHTGMRSLHHSKQRSPLSISVAEFVIHKFIPACVTNRRPSARSQFRTILNHILHSQMVRDALSTSRGGKRKRLTTTPGWPYLDSLQLNDVDTGVIQDLVNAALQRGYSAQTVRQIRNVISSIISHAIRTGYYTGPNPTARIVLPTGPKKETYTLGIHQLVSVIQKMSFPERHVTLFLLLADLRVTEICGLQWKYVNVSPGLHFVDGDVIPPKTIAVRNQTYRGEFTSAIACRRRFVRIPDLLCSVLRELKGRQQFTEPNNFVLPSRNGTPIHPENIAARRLRPIGRSLEMPWLSWSVLARTRSRFKSQSDGELRKQLQTALTLSNHQQNHNGNHASGTHHGFEILPGEPCG